MIEIISRTVEAMTLPFTISLATVSASQLEQELDKLSAGILSELERLEEKFSAFRSTSLVCRFQDGDKSVLLDQEFQEVFALAEMAYQETEGAFDPYYKGIYDPTGLVKGWVIEELFKSKMLPYLQHPDVEAVCLNGGGDMQFATKETSDFLWKIGIQNPENLQEILAVFTAKNGAIATSGYSKRGQHIQSQNDIQQITFMDTSLTRADIWATAGLSMPENALKEAIAQQQLSGLYIKSQQLQFFQKGEFIS
ncbi:FAD:protein FMN transferase [Streptococcus suis]|uniref:FAD:protein FMN transferase n=2 Tax=Streptococcus suis TaxID=1307 RepID=UPI000CF38BE5|nr:FAD:protein FMN transferase [Streptococcus suis]